MPSLETEDLLQPGDSMQTVSDKMVALAMNILPVSEGGRVVGLADEPNPGLEASSHGHEPKTTRISETMNRDLVFCHEGDDCAGALRRRFAQNGGAKPVAFASCRSRNADGGFGGAGGLERPHRDRGSRTR